MNRLILAAALAAGCILASSAPALGAARHYDCSKPGNSNKAACKTATAAPKAEAKAKPVKAAKAAPPPRVAATKPAPQPSLLQRMSNAMHGPKPASTPAAAPRKVSKAAPASVENSNPAGAIAQCKDGTYSHAKVRTGACSRHGGVAKWG